MIKTIMALLLMTGSLSAYSGVKVKDTGETARVFCLIDYKPSDVSFGAEGQPIGGEDLKIFNAIKAYWEKKTGATLANKTDENGWSDTYFVFLIKGNRIRFSTKDNTGGSLAAGVIMSKWQGDSLGILKKVDGEWVVYREEGPEYIYNFHEGE